MGRASIWTAPRIILWTYQCCENKCLARGRCLTSISFLFKKPVFSQRNVYWKLTKWCLRSPDNFAEAKELVRTKNAANVVLGLCVHMLLGPILALCKPRLPHKTEDQAVAQQSGPAHTFCPCGNERPTGKQTPSQQPSALGRMQVLEADRCGPSSASSEQGDLQKVYFSLS